MKGLTSIILIASLVALVSAPSLHSQGRTRPIIIDHTCADLSQIPAEWIEFVKNNMAVYYGHTSHGGQPTIGMRELELGDPFYSYAVCEGCMPTESNTLNIYEYWWVSPIYYWSIPSGMAKTSGILNDHAQIIVSGFGWCVEIPGYSTEQVQAYLDSMTVLEQTHPDVAFFYMTGNAGSTSENRYRNNNMIRQYCIENNKVLFDFAELDSWYFNPDTQEWEQHTFETSGDPVPLLHPEFSGDNFGNTHVTRACCLQKGRAFWWMMARLAGWDGNTPVEGASWGKIKEIFKPESQ